MTAIAPKRTWVSLFSIFFLRPEPKPFLFQPTFGVVDLEKATMQRPPPDHFYS
jgi:hypothetical protein